MRLADPDWLLNRLEVTGPDEALQEFVMAAQGPGFIDWYWPGSEDRDYWAALLLEHGAPSPAAADRLAGKYADLLWWRISDARTAADLGYSIQPLDLNVLQPIPKKILRAGWHDAGAEWCWKHWGTCLPLRHGTFRFEHRLQKQGRGIEVVAVYEFYSADWSPWRALRAWRRKWPPLRFVLIPQYELLAEMERKISREAA